MKRPALVEAILFVVLLAAGVGLRIWLQHLPNFAPVAAISLFAGYFFRSWFVAACLPILIMGVSDHFIGGYDTRMMILVHASLALPVLARSILRRWCPCGPGHSKTRYIAGIFTASLTASCIFFLVSNFGSWLWFDMYDLNLAGLVHCYANALPFFRYTLIGDVVFSTVLFGGFAVAIASGLIHRDIVPVPAPSLEA